MRSPMLALVTLALCPSLAFAQGAATTRARISISYGVQPVSSTFDGTTSQTTNLETQTTTTSYKTANGPMFDAGITVRVAGQLGVGVAVSSYSKAQDGAIAGSVPHPFFLNTPRSFDGLAPGLEHKELATHIQAVYLVPSTGRVDAAIFGGPTIFNVRQGLVSGVSYTDVYPYDSVTFASATTEVVKKTKVGFNVGGDVGFWFSRNVGVGVLFRFSRATVDLDLPGGGSTVSLDAGGPQVAGGIRFVF